MTLETIGMLAAIHLSAMLTPGPTALLVLRNSMLGSDRWLGMSTVAGVVCATIANVTLTTFGLALLVTEASSLMVIVKIAGASYLAMLGIQSMWRALWTRTPRARATETSAGNAFAQGFVTNAVNINILLFYLSVFAQFAGPDTAVSVKTACSVQVVLQSLLYWTLFVCLARGGGPISLLLRHPRSTDAVLGAVLMLFSLRTFLSL